MAMSHYGLVKLSEESAEVIQVAQKLIAYPELIHSKIIQHPDGTILLDRLEDEMADVYAAFRFVTEKLGLDKERISTRSLSKLELFRQWDKER